MILALLWFALRRSVRRIGEQDHLLLVLRQQIALLERDLARRPTSDLGRRARCGDAHSNVLSVLHSELQQAYDRRSVAYDKARRAYVEQ